MLNMSQKTDYGFLLLNLLSKKKITDFLSLTEIVDQSGLPKAFIGRIASELTNAGLLVSKEGVNGGYRLKKGLKEINLAEVISVLDEDGRLIKCGYRTHCPMIKCWRSHLQTKIWEIFEKYTLADLM